MIDKINFNKRERILSVMIIVIFAVAFYALGHKKHSKKLSSLESRLINAEHKIQKKSKQLKELHAESMNVNSTKAQSKEIKKYLEASKYLSSLIKNLGAKDSNQIIDLNVINVGNRTKVNNFYKSSFKLEIESSFIGLGKFLEDLGNAESLIEVRSVELTRIESDMKRCKAIIEINGYYQGGKG